MNQVPGSTWLPVRAPVRTAETAPFWDAAAAERLVLPRCERCQEYVWYPREFCPACGGQDVSWVEAAGTGTVYSFTIVRQGQGPYRDAAPYVVAYVELDEGPRILTNLVDVDLAQLRIGQPVRVVFERLDEGNALPRFTPD